MEDPEELKEIQSHTSKYINYYINYDFIKI
jgi:hypothetical protein